MDNTKITSASRDISNGYLIINGIKYESGNVYAVSQAKMINSEYTSGLISFCFGFSSLTNSERAVFFLIQFAELSAFYSEDLRGAVSKSIVCTMSCEDIFREICTALNQTSKPPQKTSGSIQSTIEACILAQSDSIRDFQDFFTFT